MAFMTMRQILEQVADIGDAQPAELLCAAGTDAGQVLNLGVERQSRPDRLVHGMISFIPTGRSLGSVRRFRFAINIF